MFLVYISLSSSQWYDLYMFFLSLSYDKSEFLNIKFTRINASTAIIHLLIIKSLLKHSFVKWVDLILVVRVCLKKFRVWIWQELITIERKANRMSLYPEFFFLNWFSIAYNCSCLFLHFCDVISEFIICNYVSIGLSGVLNTVAIIIVLCWSLHHVALGSKLV